MNREWKCYIPDGFIIGILVMILVAWLFPGIGSNVGYFNLKQLIDIGVSLIFFFYGLKLNTKQLKEGLSSWKLHIIVQFTTFLIFPIVVLLGYPFVRGTEYEVLWLAVFFVAVLPSAVSSSVVMVSIAHGNIPGAIFNASISGIIGILLTPAWMGIFLGRQDEAFAFGNIMGSLALQILLPVTVGLILNRFFGAWANRNTKTLSGFDKVVILCIVYESFSKSFLNDIFENIQTPVLFGLGVSVIVLFFIIFEGTKFLSTKINLSYADGITALFCGSKKSLVHGTVFGSILFAGNPQAGLFLVPIMIYHAFQLFYISIYARKVK